MSNRDDKKQQIAKQLGVSVQVLDQYLQLKRAEMDEDAAPSKRPGGKVGPAPLEDRRIGR